MQHLFVRNIAVLLCYSIALCPSIIQAAIGIDISHQSTSFIESLISQGPNNSAGHIAYPQTGSKLEIIRSKTDFNQTTHVKFKQTYNGFNVWGGEVITHIPYSNGTYKLTLLKNSSIQIPQNAVSNGLVYDKLENDILTKAPDKTIRQQVAEKISKTYLSRAQVNGDIFGLHSETLIYVPATSAKAIWAYKISFTVKNSRGIIAEPILIVDAQSHEIYQQWDQIENYQNKEVVTAGGYGGNPNTGRLSYDDATTDYPSFTVVRAFSYNPLDNNFMGNCYLENDNIKIVVKHLLADSEYTFPCRKTDELHNNTYWNGDYMTINGGYSPPNDAIYGVQVVTKLFKDWYSIPLLTDTDHKTPRQVLVKFWDDDLFPPVDKNASWNSLESYITLGRGGEGLYPFTSVGIIAHELGHGFTTQHSNLTYAGGSGAMNEAFSDMTAQAAEYYLTGKNDWRIGREIIADPFQVGCSDTQDCAFRYMDNPGKDGKSTDNVVVAMKQKLDVHYSSGVFNKMFYLLATKPGWDIKMAFNVMVQANQFYWLSGDGTARNYKPIACGIIAATKDYYSKDSRYDINSVIGALKAIGFKDDGKPIEYPYYDYDIKDCK